MSFEGSVFVLIIFAGFLPLSEFCLPAKLLLIAGKLPLCQKLTDYSLKLLLFGAKKKLILFLLHDSHGSNMLQIHFEIINLLLQFREQNLSEWLQSILHFVYLPFFLLVLLPQRLNELLADFFFLLAPTAALLCFLQSALKLLQLTS